MRDRTHNVAHLDRTERISVPAYNVGDRLVLKSDPSRKVTVVSVDGPYIYHGFDRTDAYLFRCREDNGLSYPASRYCLTRER